MGRFLGVAMIVIGVAGLLLSMSDWRPADQTSPKEQAMPDTRAEAPAAAPTSTSEDRRGAQATEIAQPPQADGDAGDDRAAVEQAAAAPAGTSVASLDGARIKVFDQRDPPDERSSLPWVDIAAASEVVEEGGEPVNFRVTLSEPSKLPIVIIFSTVDNSATSDTDFQSQRGTVTFEPGMVSAEIQTPILDDQNKEGDEQFSIVLNGAPGVVNFRNRHATATIKDND